MIGWDEILEGDLDAELNIVENEDQESNHVSQRDKSFDCLVMAPLMIQRELPNKQCKKLKAINYPQLTPQLRTRSKQRTPVVNI